VNPVVAVLLGAFLRSEIITATILIGGSIVVFGIALVVLGEKREKLVNPET
jgi:drug/metabolite transporter (DMT)-like permease